MERLLDAINAEDWRTAFRVAATMTGWTNAARVEVGRAWEAMNRPEFLRQIKIDPDEAIAKGKAMVLARFERAAKERRLPT